MSERLINICFHGVGSPRRSLDPGEAPYWISTDLFRRALDLCVGRSDVSISFDDGNGSDVEVGLPGLMARGLSAMFFPIAGRLTRPGSLSVDDLRTLVGHGMTVGSHGMRHIPWRGLSEGEQVEEFIRARAALSDASGREVRHAALPLGRYDRKVLKRLRQLGYASVFTSDRMPASRRSWLQSRYSIRSGDTPETVAFILSGRDRMGAATAKAKSIVKRLR